MESRDGEQEVTRADWIHGEAVQEQVDSNAARREEEVTRDDVLVDLQWRHVPTVSVMSSNGSGALNRRTSSTTDASSDCDGNCR